MTAAAVDPGESRLERTGRWRGVHALALAAAGIGILTGTPLAIVAGLAGVGFAAYSRVWEAPAPALVIERHVDETEPRPGDRVSITVSVRNAGDRLLPDLRLCDDVPAGLRVVDGTPRHTTALRPGKTATISYEVAAVRGAHTFDSVTVISRDVSGATQRVERAESSPVRVVCRPRFGSETAPLGDLATLLPGRRNVDATGQGIAFHSLREYRRGDPQASVDWNRLAKTGDLATRRYDQPRAVEAVLVVDARATTYVTGDGTANRPAVDVCALAAGRLACGLLDDGVRVGLAALGPRPCWLAPAAGGGHRERLLDRLTTDPAFGWEPPEGDGPDGMDRVLTRLPGDAQVIFLSPVVDDRAAEFARQCAARGHDVAVASPDVTARDSPCRRLAAAERRLRLDDLRGDRFRVVEWTPGARTESGNAPSRSSGETGQMSGPRRTAGWSS